MAMEKMGMGSDKMSQMSPRKAGMNGGDLYEIYGNASKLVGYATQPDGSLSEVSQVDIPYNSPQGLAGF